MLFSDQFFSDHSIQLHLMVETNKVNQILLSCVYFCNYGFGLYDLFVVWRKVSFNTHSKNSLPVLGLNSVQNFVSYVNKVLHWQRPLFRTINEIYYWEMSSKGQRIFITIDQNYNELDNATLYIHKTMLTNTKSITKIYVNFTV